MLSMTGHSVDGAKRSGWEQMGDPTFVLKASHGILHVIF